MRSTSAFAYIHRAQVTAWDSGEILVMLDGKPVTDVSAESMQVALGWAALAGVACRIVTEIPAQEVADRAAAAVEQARLAAEQEQALADVARAEAATAAAAAVAREADEAARRAAAVRGYIAERDAWIAAEAGRDEAGYMAMIAGGGA